MLKKTMKCDIEREVLDRLLIALERASEAGDAKEAIRLSKFILRLADKRFDVFVQDIPEHDG